MRESNFLNILEKHFKNAEDPKMLEKLKNEKFDFGNELHRYIVIEEDPNFVYGHYKIDGGQATIGGIKLENKLYYAVSFCSPTDNFSKNLGRKFVRNSFIDPSNSRKRGVMNVSGRDDSPPAQILRGALEYHVNKMTNKPHWFKNMHVDFRSPKRLKFHLPHADIIRPICGLVEKNQ